MISSFSFGVCTFHLPGIYLLIFFTKSFLYASSRRPRTVSAEKVLFMDFLESWPLALPVTQLI